MGEIRVATFDCYGTLIDWEGGIGAFLTKEIEKRTGIETPSPGRARAEYASADDCTHPLRR